MIKLKSSITEIVTVKIVTLLVIKVVPPLVLRNHTVSFSSVFFPVFYFFGSLDTTFTMQTVKESGSLTTLSDGVYQTKYGDTQKLNSFNYRQWAWSIQIFLQSENALAIALGEEEQPPAEDRQNHSNWIACEEKALVIIYNSCTSVTQEHVEDVNSASEMWRKLKDKFDTLNSHASQLEVRWNFNQARAQPGQTIEDYIACLLHFWKTLAGTESAITNETFKSHLLSTLPKEYDNYIDILMEQESQHSIDSLIKRLLEWEKTLLSHQAENSSSNLSITSSSTLLTHHTPWPGRQVSTTGTRGGQSRVHRGERFHSSHQTHGMIARGHGQGRFSWNRHDQPSRLGGTGRVGAQRSSSGSLCWYCGRGGHYRRECSAQSHGLEAQRSDKSGRANHQFAEVAYTLTISHAFIVTCL